ncbi:MAG: hypothetical protein ABIQ17_04880, partial [Candidatus Limnocylindrales bacterium]
EARIPVAAVERNHELLCGTQHLFLRVRSVSPPSAGPWARPAVSGLGRRLLGASRWHGSGTDRLEVDRS